MNSDKREPDQERAWRHHLQGLLILGAMILQCACATKSPAPADQQGLDAGADRAKTLVLTTVTVPAALTLEVATPVPTGNPKLGSSLSQLVEVHQQEGAMSAQAFARAHMMVLKDGRVEVEVIAATDAIEDLTEAIEAEGGEVEGHHGTLVQALLPTGAVESLAQREDVQVIRAVRRAGH